MSGSHNLPPVSSPNDPNIANAGTDAPPGTSGGSRPSVTHAHLNQNPVRPTVLLHPRIIQYSNPLTYRSGTIPDPLMPLNATHTENIYSAPYFAAANMGLSNRVQITVPLNRDTPTIPVPQLTSNPTVNQSRPNASGQHVTRNPMLPTVLGMYAPPPSGITDPGSYQGGRRPQITNVGPHSVTPNSGSNSASSPFPPTAPVPFTGWQMGRPVNIGASGSSAGPWGHTVMMQNTMGTHTHPGGYSASGRPTTMSPVGLPTGILRRVTVSGHPTFTTRRTDDISRHPVETVLSPIRALSFRVPLEALSVKTLRDALPELEKGSIADFKKEMVRLNVVGPHRAGRYECSLIRFHYYLYLYHGMGLSEYPFPTGPYIDVSDFRIQNFMKAPYREISKSVTTDLPPAIQYYHEYLTKQRSFDPTLRRAVTPPNS